MLRHQKCGGRWWSVVLLGWVVLCEVGTEGWYRAHEAKLPAPVTWTVKPPQENPTLRHLPLSEKTRRLLRYDEALNACWDEGELHFQAIFLRWNPGRTAVHLAKTHTPEACVTAAGRRMVSKSDVRVWKVADLELPIRCYVFEDPQGPLHVYYCLWEDQAVGRGFDSAALTYGNRLAPVLAGIRLCGQRSLELAVWGCGDEQRAEDVVRRKLGKMIKH